MGVSKNSGFFSPESSILIGFSRIKHPFWDTPSFGNAQILLQKQVWEFFFLKVNLFQKKNATKNIKESTHIEKERVKIWIFVDPKDDTPPKHASPVKREGNRFQAASNADWFDGDASGRPVTWDPKEICRVLRLFQWHVVCLVNLEKKNWVIYFWITRKQM